MNTPSSQPTVLRNRKVPAWLWAIFLGCLPLLLYGYALRMPFYCDDFFLYAEISGNSYAQRSQGFSLYHLIDEEVVREYPQVVPWWTSPDTRIHFFRPVSSLSLLLDHRIWKKDPFGYRLTSMILHGLTCILLFLIGRLLFQRDSVAVLAVLIFSSHPWVLLVVFWVAERPSVLAMVFGLAGLYSHIRFREGSAWPWEALAWGCFLLALFSRESGAICIGSYFLYDFFLARTVSPGKKKSLVGLMGYYAVLGLPVLIFIACYKASGYGSVGYYSIFDGTGPLAAKIAFLFKNVILYACSLLFFMPVFSEMNIYLFRRLAYLLPVAVAATLFFLFLYPGVKRRLLAGPAYLFLASWALISLLPTLPLLTQNRYIYQAAAPFSLFVGGYLFGIRRENIFGKYSRRLFQGAVAFLVLLPMAVVTFGGSRIARLYDSQSELVRETQGYLEGIPPPANVFFINVPNALLAFALQHAFDFYSTKGLVRTFVLTVSKDLPEVEVLGERTLLVKSSSGPFLESEAERFLMTDYEEACREGFTRSNAFFKATTQEVRNGHISAIRFDFDSPISAESMRFFFVRDRHPVPVAFPTNVMGFPFSLAPP